MGITFNIDETVVKDTVVSFDLKRNDDTLFSIVIKQSYSMLIKCKRMV